ncbi:DUF5455 family protein [Vibrio tritonius]|uniref:DUF5455 family protein n=1 Tax=Vibrio tritonius TaxID=1435069 RepID=UPI000838B177|nr:DUF5455 family protein [Vibrio tritonius]
MPAFLLPILSSVGAALRLPALAAFFAGLVSNILAWFAKFFARNTAMNLTVITMLITLTTATTGAIYAVAAGLSQVLPSYVSDALGLLIPSNAIPCISAVLSARLLRWVWSWQFFMINKMGS